MNNEMMREIMMRDMARGRMSRGMRDGRNPYGSRGGYITSRDPRRRDRNHEMPDYARVGRDYEEEYNQDYARARMGRQRDMYGYYPFEVMGRVGYEEMHDPYIDDMMYDYSRGRGMRDYAEGSMLTNRELMDWSQKLMQELEEKDKAYFKYDNIEKKAKEMGMTFDKYSFDEFYTTVLMMVTDYCKTLGTANPDVYLRLSKDFLEDKDSALKYSDKLSAYYDYVIMGM